MLFRPQLHTVPFPFSATKYLDPPTIFGVVIFPSPFTFILTADDKLFFLLYNFINVVPCPTAVTSPVFSSTVATFGSSVLNVHSLSGTDSINKLNSIDILYCIVSFSPALVKFIVFFGTFILFLLIHQGVIKFSNVSFPISPCSLYPTVYTIPS